MKGIGLLLHGMYNNLVVGRSQKKRDSPLLRILRKSISVLIVFLHNERLFLSSPTRSLYRLCFLKLK